MKLRDASSEGTGLTLPLTFERSLRAGVTLELRIFARWRQGTLVLPCVVRHTRKVRDELWVGLKMLDVSPLLEANDPKLFAVFNRRTNYRVAAPASMKVQIRPTGTPEPVTVEGTLINLSLCGMRVELKRADALQVGQREVDVAFRMPGHPAPVVLRAAPAYRRLVSEVTGFLGFAFAVAHPTYEASKPGLRSFIMEAQRREIHVKNQGPPTAAAPG